MEKLRNLNPILKGAIALALFIFSYLVQPHQVQTSYITLFLGLFVIFEGYGLNLFWKILIALTLGLGISLSPLFSPDFLIVMRPVGSDIFMNLLTMALVPLVFSSIVTGVTSLGDIQKLNRIGLKTIVYYITTTAIAISIGLFFANLIQPGKNLDGNIRTKFEQNFKSSADSKVRSAEENKQTLFQTVTKIIPKNIVNTISGPKPDMLALIFFAIISGLALLKTEAKKAKPVIQFFEGITEMTIQLVIMAMRVAPYGVFAIIAATIAKTQSTELLLSLIPFSLCVLLGLLVHMVGMNTLSLIFLSGRRPMEVFSKLKEVAITAFSTSSSGATMPLTMKTAEKDLGVSKEVSGFVIPLGATINMDGTALFQGVSAIFLANIYGIDLSIGGQLTVIGMAVMASIGTAAVPGVGIVILTMILVSVGIPPEGILFILPVNNLLDMCRTVVNVVGDMVCSIYIDSSEKSKS
ncbi:MAG: dicarboxylate/amino acid:cation symporter [Bdellovibrionales bacterium]